MCLIGLLYRVHPDYPILLAANRDEFYARSTARADWWADQPDLLGGRDLEAGGTWLAIHRDGRWGCLTNHRDLHKPLLENAPSRGELVPAFLRSHRPAADYLADLHPHASAYNGFNLLLWDGQALCHYSNEEGSVNPVVPGIHGLSNALLDTPWPKVTQLKRDLADLLAQGQAADPQALFACLHNRELAPDAALPDTGIGLDWERPLSAMHIEMPTYGTRVASVLRVKTDGGVDFWEQGFEGAGELRYFQVGV